VGVRQAYMLIRNLGVEGLSLKAGRQLVVMGNHRLFGHFDWNNIGFSFDGVTMQYNQPKYEIWAGWVRLSDQEAAANGAASGGVAGGGAGSANADMLFTRLAFKPMAGLSLEPLWVFFNNKTSTAAPAAQNVLAPHAPGQNRHTLGGRAAFKQGMFDATAEYYWQTGSIQLGGSPNRLHINAQAFAAVAGVTLKAVPTAPRFGVEFNYASGDGSAGNCSSATGAGCGGNANTFENLYPTNHILMGYADRMAWRNMVGYSADVKLKPSAATHFEFKYWMFRKANNSDCWYTASQGCVAGTFGSAVNTSNSLFQEVDGIYTLFFADNKVAWQTGISYLLAGQMQDQIRSGNAAGNTSAVDSIWGYTQLHVNF
jgi:Alginate export